MELREFFSEDAVKLDLEGTTKDDILKELIGLLKLGEKTAALAAFDRLEGLWIVPAIVILAREFLISGLREYLGPQNVKVPVSKLAKWKTGFQMTALGFLVIGDYGDNAMQTVFGWTIGGADVIGALLTGQILLAMAAVITIITGWNYLKIGFRHI